MPACCSLGKRPRRGTAGQEPVADYPPLPVLFHFTDVSRPRAPRATPATPSPTAAEASPEQGRLRDAATQRSSAHAQGGNTSSWADDHKPTDDPAGRSGQGHAATSRPAAAESRQIEVRQTTDRPAARTSDAPRDSQAVLEIPGTGSRPAPVPAEVSTVPPPAASATGEPAAPATSLPLTAFTAHSTGATGATSAAFPDEFALTPDPQANPPAPVREMSSVPASSTTPAPSTVPVSEAASKKNTDSIGVDDGEAPSPAAAVQHAATERPPATEEWIVAHARFIALAFIAALIGTVYLARSHRRAASQPHRAAPSQAVEPTIEMPSLPPVDAAGGSALPAASAADAARSVMRPADAAPPVATTELGAPQGAIPRMVGAAPRSANPQTTPAADPLFVFPAPAAATTGNSPTTSASTNERNLSSAGLSASATAVVSPASAVEAAVSSAPGNAAGRAAMPSASTHAGSGAAGGVPPMPTHYPGSAPGPASAQGTSHGAATVSSAGVSYPVTSPVHDYARPAGPYGAFPADGAAAAKPASGRQVAPNVSANLPLPPAAGAGSWVPPASYPTTATRETRHERIGSGNY